MKSILITLCSLLLIATATAQQGSIKGKVQANNAPLANTTVLLLNSKDSSLAKTNITNAAGEYELESIKPGNYLIQYTAVGYKPVYSNAITVADNATTQVPTATLTATVTTSKEVVVLGAKKPLIEVKADKTVFNVENSINAIGTNAFELLRKAPGVVVDRDDNLILKGKNGVRIFLDGKPTPFTAKDLAAYLKNLNSADIEAIEIITNPSAKYEAEGNAGIINIKLKKSKKLGYNGSVTLGFAQGLYPKTNSSITMNYRKNKWNVFGNYSNNFGKNWNRFKLYRIQLDTIYDQTTIGINDDQSHNYKVGTDYTMDKNNTFGVVLTGGYATSNNNSNSSSPITKQSTGIKNSTLLASNIIDQVRKNLNVNFNYRYTDTTGIEVGVDFDRGSFNNTSDSYQPNEYRYQANLLVPDYRIYRNLTPTDIAITSLKLDFGVPFKKGKLEFGGKYSNVDTKNASDFFNVINNVNQVDVGRTNKFNYKEQINALYANYNRPLTKKVTLQAGLRVENTISDGNLISSTPSPTNRVKRNYTNFFPSGALSYNANANNMFNLTYSRRIDRPGYQALNPFEYKLDELTFQKGNAFLRPQYSSVYELSHTFKYRYTTSLNYTRTTDFSTQIIDTAEGNKSFITQRNLAVQDVYGINFSIPTQLAKWWNLYANVNVNYTKYDATFPDGKKINTSVTSGSFFAQNTFSLSQGFAVELSGFYQLPTIWGGTFESKGIGGMDVGFSAPLFANKSTIRFSYTDVLNTLRWRGISQFAGSYLDASGRWESQQFKMNFTYRFGNNKLRSGSKKESGNSEEQKRAKQSGSGGFGGQ